jgi:hypothetical protein
MRAIAQMRSIPRALPSKEERFTKGALRNMAFAPRGQGYYDAFTQVPENVVLSSAVGPVTAISGIGRQTISGGFEPNGTFIYSLPLGTSTMSCDCSTDNSTMIVLNPGASGSVVGWVLKPIVDPNNSTGLIIEKQEITIPQFEDFGPTTEIFANNFGYIISKDTETAVHEGPAGRVESIPLRLSVQIRNTTAALNVGGMVRFLRYNGGLALSDTHDGSPDSGVHPAGADTGTQAPYPPSGEVELVHYMLLKDMVRKAQRTKHLSGSELTTPFQSNSYPADAIRSMTFESTDTFSKALREPKYSTTIILIDEFVGTSGNRNNSYELTISAQRAGRFAPGSALHNLARVPRAHGPTHTAQMKQEATKHAGSYVDSIADKFSGLRQQALQSYDQLPGFDRAWNGAGLGSFIAGQAWDHRDQIISMMAGNKGLRAKIGY